MLSGRCLKCDTKTCRFLKKEPNKLEELYELVKKEDDNKLDDKKEDEVVNVNNLIQSQSQYNLYLLTIVYLILSYGIIIS